MRHAYLTKEEIDYSYRHGGITLQEAQELQADMNRCADFIKSLEKLAAKQRV